MDRFKESVKEAGKTAKEAITGAARRTIQAIRSSSADRNQGGQPPGKVSQIGPGLFQTRWGRKDHDGNIVNPDYESPTTPTTIATVTTDDGDRRRAEEELDEILRGDGAKGDQNVEKKDEAM